MWTRKRKSSSFKRGVKRRRTDGYKRNPWGYGPVGGNTRPRRGGLSQATLYQPTFAPDRLFIKLRLPIGATLSTGAAGVFATSYLVTNSTTTSAGGTFLGAVAPSGVGLYLGAPGAAMYSQYCVHAFAYDVTVSTGATGPLLFGMSPRGGVISAPATGLEALANPYEKHCLVAAGAPAIRLRSFHRTSQVYGASPQAVAIADSFSAAYNASPASLITLDLWAQNLGSATLIGANCAGHVMLYVEVFGRRKPA